MSRMFYGSDDLQTLDVSNLDTSKVTNMSGMFGVCVNLESLDVSNFDTSKVTDMNGMFDESSSIIKLDVSNFDTSKVTDMSHMFGHLYRLTEIDVSNFNTSKVTDMSNMFHECNGLRILDVSNFDTSKVTTMENMFFECKLLSEIDLSNFNTSNVTNMAGMFCDCENVTKIDVSNFDTSKVTDMNCMFIRCKKLPEIDVTNFDTSKLTNMNAMFSGCDSLQYIDLSVFVNKPYLEYRNLDLSEDTKRGDVVPTVIISQNEHIINTLSKDGGKTLPTHTTRATRVAYTADVRLDANGGFFKEKATANGKTITLGSNIFYDTVDAYKNEFTVSNDKLAEKTSSPTKDGEEFNGWYLDKECTKPLETLDVTLGHDSEVTLYAGYGEKKAEIDKPADKPETDNPTGDKNNSTANPVQKMTKAVQTGDFSSPYFWAFVALIAMIGAAVTVIVRRKSVRTN